MLNHRALRLVWLLPMGIERPSGRRYFNLARALAKQGHRVRLLALHPDLASCARRRFVQDGVEVWYVGQMHARKSGTTPQRFGPLALLGVLLRSTAGMLWGILCSPADAYHLGKPQPINGLAALVGVMAVRNQRFFVDCDDDEVESNRFTAAWQRRVFAFWQSLLPRLARGATANTPFLMARLRRAGVPQIVYVPNGVDLSHWTLPPAAETAQLRQALGLAEQRVVAYVGTLALHNHPVLLLVHAFAAIAAQSPDVALLLIGGGEDVARLRAVVDELGLRERVRFTGDLLPALVRRYLALAVVSVDPVNDDAVARARSPLKIFESMALGIPVVTGAVGDRAALLDNGAAGMLVPPGDSAALATALHALLTDETRRAALALAAREHVAQYAWERLAEQWIKVYQ